MNDFLDVMNLVFSYFRHPFELYGFTFSLWDVIVFIFITSTIIAFIRSMYGD